MILTECSVCETTVAADTLARYTAILDVEKGATERITFARCPDCSGPLLVAEELYDTTGGVEVWSNSYGLYPQRDQVRPRVPRAVVKWYDEARRCYQARAYNAVAMMCSRTVHAVAIERHIDEPRLPLALAEMLSQGVIESRMYEWAEHLSQLSDTAADTTTLSREDARDVLEFTEAFLAYVYTFRKGFHDFQTRREERAIEPPPIASEPTALAVAAAAASRPSNGSEPD